MNERFDPDRCTAQTRAGNRCKNKARPGSAYCYRHRPAEAAVEAEEIPVEEELSESELRRRLIVELDSLLARVQALMPDYRPRAFSTRGVSDLVDKAADRMEPGLRQEILNRLRVVFKQDLLDAETWKGMWYMLSYTVNYQSDMLRRRLTGEYETDDWGLDWEFVETVRPFLDFMYKIYWRVETTGIEHIPDYDRALLVSNHSGQLPWDGAMIMTAVLNEHPAQRLVRNLYADWFPTLPFLSASLVKMGQALASVENGTRLLEQDELVCVYPEGYKGVGKLFKDRYKLARFGRGGFVKMALNTQAPIIPVSVVGAEETYVSLAKSTLLARLTGFPNFPISPTFPWLGAVGMIPLPTKWYIDIGEPIPMDGYDPDEAGNLAVVAQLADRVRDQIQEMVHARLAQRRSVFR